jgi:biopolymer transport protein ExbD
MRFPRRIQHIAPSLYLAPTAGVLFILMIFVGLSNHLVFTTGVPIRLPAAANLSGTPNPVLTVAVDAAGNIYYENQIIPEGQLRARLAQEVRRAKESVTLVLEADRDVRHEMLVRLALLARDAGIKDAILATSPRSLDPLPAQGEP